MSDALNRGRPPKLSPMTNSEVVRRYRLRKRYRLALKYWPRETAAADAIVEKLAREIEPLGITFDHVCEAIERHKASMKAPLIPE